MESESFLQIFDILIIVKSSDSIDNIFLLRPIEFIIYIYIYI